MGGGGRNCQHRILHLSKMKEKYFLRQAKLTNSLPIDLHHKNSSGSSGRRNTIKFGNLDLHKEIEHQK